MSLAQPAPPDIMPAPHPNEMDLLRIDRALRARTRYRYVSPRTEPVNDGYLVRSPCCSRGPDANGGEIDIALIQWRGSPLGWQLLRRDHGAQAWIADSNFARLADLLKWLNTDPQKTFWQ